MTEERLLYSSLTDQQRRLIVQLAQADEADPGTWVDVTTIHKYTLRRLNRLDLIFTSHSEVDIRARITLRGRRYYCEVIQAYTPKDKYDDDTIRQLIAAARTDESYTSIAQRFGCSPAYLSVVMRGKSARYKRLLDESGIDPVCRTEKYKQQVINAVIRMRQEGASYKEIVEATGMSMANIGYHLRQAGLVETGWVSEETYRRCVRLYLSGLTMREVAQQIGRSRRIVGYALKAYRAGVLKL